MVSVIKKKACSLFTLWQASELRLDDDSKLEILAYPEISPHVRELQSFFVAQSQFVSDERGANFWERKNNPSFFVESVTGYI